MHLEFTWSEYKAASNIIKHKVSFEEAMSVFDDNLALFREDPDSEGEERFIVLGRSDRDNVLLVCHCYLSEDQVRLISARKASKQETQQYMRQIYER